MVRLLARLSEIVANRRTNVKGLNLFLVQLDLVSERILSEYKSYCAIELVVDYTSGLT